MNVLEYFRMFNYVAKIKSHKIVFKAFFFLEEKGLDNI